MKDFDTALHEWLGRAQKIAYTDLTIDPRGKKYIRIVGEGSVFCFIEKSNGNVLKAASWKAPAKHSRGNIYVVGQEGVSKYGANYLK